MQYGGLPLYYAAWQNKSEAVIKALLDAYPDAAKEKTDWGDLPKDYAKTDAIKALLAV